MSTVSYIPRAAIETLSRLDTGGPLASCPGATVSIGHRTRAGSVEIHDHETDTFYVLEGEATVVTGGEVEGLHTESPGQHRGSGIAGGTRHALRKGDAIVIPSGVPHWFAEVPERIVYYVVKVSAP